MPVKKQKPTLIAVTDNEIKNGPFYRRFWIWFKNSGISSRELPELLSMFQLEIMFHEVEIVWSNTNKIYKLQELDSGVIGDEDGRTIRNILEADGSGVNPKRISRQYELIRQIFLVIQWENPKVAELIRK